MKHHRHGKSLGLASASPLVALLKEEVLVDGGKIAGSSGYILSAIEDVSTQYTYAAGQTQLQFDAIIVSHWDIDHYKGLRDLLRDDLIAQYEQQVKVLRTPRLNTTGATQVDLSKIRSSFMRYASDTDTPLTTFYCPAWDASRDADFSVKDEDKEPKENQYEHRGHAWQFEEREKGFMSVFIGNFDKDVTKEIFNRNGKRKETGTEESLYAPKVCKLAYGPSVLGTDFFTGRIIPEAERADAKMTPASIATEHDLKTTGMPAFICVGTCRQTLGARMRNLIPPRKEIVEFNDLTNAMSIASVLVWPDGHVSLYTGGDAEGDCENRLADGFLKAIPVTAIKAGHHGSSLGTTTQFINNSSPRKVVFSAGEQHGHPHWSKLAYLHAYFAYRELMDGVDEEDRVYSTCYPYWFVLPSELSKPVDFNPELLSQNASGSRGAAFQTAYKKVCADYDAEWKRLEAKRPQPSVWDYYVPSVIDAYVEWEKVAGRPKAGEIETEDADKLTDSERLRLLRAEAVTYFICVVWAGISAITGDMAARNTETAAGSKHSLKNRLKFLWIKHRPKGDKDDGSIVILGGGGWLSEPKRSNESKIEAKQDNTNDSAYLRRATTDRTRLNAGAKMISNAAKRLKTSEGIYRTESLAPQFRLMAMFAPGTETLPSGDAKPLHCTLPLTHASSDFLQLEASDSVHTFFDYLHRQALFLEASPNGAKDDGFLSYSFASADEVQMWLRAVGEVREAHLVGKKSSPSSMDVQALAFTVSVPSAVKLNGPSTLADTATVLTARFTSHNTALRRMFGEAAAIATPTDLGYLPSAGEGVLLALTETSFTDRVTLGDVFNYVGQATPWYLQLAAVGEEFTLADPSIANFSKDLFSAIWFYPADGYKTVIKMAFVSTKPGALRNLLADHLPGLQIGEPSVQATKVCRYRGPDPAANLSYNRRATVTMVADVTFPPGSVLGSFRTYSRFEEDSLRITLRWTGEADPISALLSTINASISRSNTMAGNTHAPSIDNAFNSWLSSLNEHQPLALREATLRICDGVQSVQFVFEVDTSIGVPNGQTAPFLVYFGWERGQVEFKAQLWPRSVYGADDPDPIINGEYDPLARLQLSKSVTPAYISLLHLIPGSDSLDQSKMPACLNPVIHDLELDISSTSVGFFASVATLRADESTIPTIELENLDLSLRYTFATPNTSPFFELGLEGSLILQARESLNNFRPSAQLSAEVAYHGDQSGDQSRWTISVTTSQVLFASLYDLFSEGGQNDAIMNMMEQVYVPFARATYEYSARTPSKLTMIGTLLIGQVELDLMYTHTGEDWRLTAALTKDRKAIMAAQAKAGPDLTHQCKLGNVLADISADLAGVVPDIIADIPLDFLATIEMDLVCKKAAAQTAGDSDAGHMVFAVSVQLGSFEFTFVQLQRYSATASTTGMSTTRVVKLTMDSLPTVNLELINKLEQPFEAIDFIWTSGDLTKAEVDMINHEVFLNHDVFARAQEPIRYKGTADADPQQVVCTQGCHFMLVLNRSGVPAVVVDYTFGKTAAPNRTAVSTTTPPPTAEDVERQKAMKAMVGDGRTTTVPFEGATQGTASGLTISNLGFAMANKTITIVLDAKLKLGPIGFELLGFGLNIEFGQHLRDYKLSATFQGLALEFHKPPVEMAGLFHKISKPDVSGYAGGIDIGIVPYRFLAAGMYGDCRGPPPYKTVFVFARLDGPLIELEFAEINGICGGFGYNSSLRIPDVANVSSFPFLSAKVLPADPMEQLTALTDGSTWIRPSPDSVWMSAGLGVRAFQLIDIQAVVSVNLGTSVNLSLVAEATASLPKGSTGDAVFLMVDFVLTATVDFTAGKLEVAGALTPASYILHPSCQLRGCFALSYWFEGSGHDGDWVFTIGGYHPQFQRPDHYPKADRLGISWRYDDHLTIGGEAYFAITPKMCMAGALVQARFHMDTLRVWFDAHADFLVNYDPFQYYGEVGVDLGASYTVDHWYCHDTFSLSFSASVTLHGPPMAGTVHVSWWVCDIDIAFGPGYAPKPAKTLPEFWAMLTQQNNGDRQHMVVAEQGVLPSETSTMQEAAPWRVRAGSFAFRVQLRAAATSAVFLDREVSGPHQLHAKPMKDEGRELTSKVTLRIKADRHGEQPLFDVKPIMKEVPSALYGEYSAWEDPDITQNSTVLHSDGSNSITAIMCLAVKAPPALNSNDPLLSFDSLKANSRTLLKDDQSTPEIPRPQAIETRPLNEGFEDPIKRQQKVIDTWGRAPSAMSLDRSQILTSFARVVSKIAGPKIAARYEEIGTDPPKELLAEFGSLCSAAPAIASYATGVP